MRCYAFSCSVYSFQALTCASSQLHQASTPSPVLALIGNISISGLRLVRELAHLVHVEVEVGKDVDLVYDQRLAHLKHQRVLERLVVALGHGEYCDILDRAGVELRRADEVANVLEYREVEVGGAELTEPPARSCPRRGGTCRRCVAGCS